MAKRTNIVDFDQARAASRSRRASQAARKGAGRPSNYPQQNENDFETREGSRAPQRSGARPSGSAGQQGRDGRNERPDRQAPPRSRKRQQPRANATGERRSPEPAKGRRPQPIDAREQRRRDRTKARAEKMFDKQFSAEAGQMAEREGDAPRAALYEGKMGSTHRKSARMQRASEAGPVSAKVNPAGWFSKLTVAPRTVRIATAALCAILIGLFLYVPAQQYYKSVREHDRLEAEYAVIAERNQVIDEQNDSLAGDAGMEDAVRQKYGYVVKGDQTAVVTGLSDRTTDSSRDGEQIEANVLSSAVKAPEKWYTPYLDAFFGVS